MNASVAFTPTSERPRRADQELVDLISAENPNPYTFAFLFIRSISDWQLMQTARLTNMPVYATCDVSSPDMVPALPKSNAFRAFFSM
jgi:hypothetical protein